jgi:tetratricopeptide (TPR) repeat protein
VAGAREWAQEGLRLCRRIDHLGGALAAHSCAGDIAMREGRREDAAASYLKALEIEELVNHPQLRGPLLIKLGEIEADLGRIEEACAYCDEAVRVADQVGDKRVAINALVGLASARRFGSDFDGARAAIDHALAKAGEIGAQPQIAAVLSELARVALASGDPDRAARAVSLLRHLDVPTARAGHARLIADLGDVVVPDHRSLDEGLSELISERQFGVMRL